VVAISCSAEDFQVPVQFRWRCTTPGSHAAV